MKSGVSASELLAPVMKDYFMIMMANESGDGWGLYFPRFVLQLRKVPGINLNQEKLPDRRSNLGPLGGK